MVLGAREATKVLHTAAALWKQGHRDRGRPRNDGEASSERLPQGFMVRGGGPHEGGFPSFLGHLTHICFFEMLALPWLCRTCLLFRRDPSLPTGKSDPILLYKGRQIQGLCWQ